MSTLQQRRNQIGVTVDTNNLPMMISAALIGSLLAIRVSVRNEDTGGALVVFFVMVVTTSQLSCGLLQDLKASKSQSTKGD